MSLNGSDARQCRHAAPLTLRVMAGELHPQTYTIPSNVYEDLALGFVENVARDIHDMVRTSNRRPSETLLTPGDPFARVITWLWRDDPDEAVKVFVTYIHSIRRSIGDPDLDIEHILLGARSIRGHYLSDDEVDALLDRVRREVGHA
jgi:hypothetical protein